MPRRIEVVRVLCMLEIWPERRRNMDKNGEEEGDAEAIVLGGLEGGKVSAIAAHGRIT